MERPLYIAGGRRQFRQPGGPEQWGTPMPLLHRSITEPDEAELVTQVLNDAHYRDTLFNIKGFQTKDALVLECVDLRRLRRDVAGDVDILVIPRDEPELSTAIQVKRFEARVRMNERGEDTVEGGSARRFRKLMAKGIKQANRTKRLGFAQVYLWIFVVIDTRERNSGWYTYDGPDSLLCSQIKSAISPVGLDPAIGLIEFEWVQPMDRPPFALGTHRGHLTKLAETGVQPAELTSWVRTLDGVANVGVAARSFGSLADA
jgi:hypothetical protein